MWAIPLVLSEAGGWGWALIRVFLARLLILIKKSRLLQLKVVVVAVDIYLWAR